MKVSSIFRIIPAVCIIFYIFQFLFFWMFQTTDSIFYYALAEFFKTGKYIVPFPYFYTRSSTMEPPLYSVLIYLALYFPRPDIILHFFHIAAVLASGAILSWVLLKTTKSRLAASAGWLFTLLPANIIYASNIMSEIFTVAFVSLYLLLNYKIIMEKKEKLYFQLLVLSAIGALMRYNLLAFWGIFQSFFLFKKNKKIMDFFGFSLSILIIVSWIFLNHNWNGSWGFSNGQGKNLFNRVVWEERLMPPRDNRDYKEIVARLGRRDYYSREAWWKIEPYVLNKEFDETAENSLLQRIAISAILNNPVKYLVKSIGSYFVIHGNGIPFHDQVWMSHGRDKDVCQPLGSIETCRPIIENGKAKKIFAKIVVWGAFYHLRFPAILNLFLLLPALIWAVFVKNRFYRISAFMYFAGTILPVFVVHTDVRYIYSVYPIKLVLIVLFLNFIWKRFIKLSRIHKYSYD